MQDFKLSFSGGGFRAAFYCLGAYRRLVELGIHANVSHISSVSGGSITAGAIMSALADKSISDVHDFDKRVVFPMRELGQVDLRRKLVQAAFSIKKSNISLELPRTRFGRVFPSVLDTHIYHNKSMIDLPEFPEWSCNATCLNTMKRFRFKPSDMYGHKIGTCCDVSDISVALAVASSASFPLLFAPIRLSTAGKQFVDKYGSSDYEVNPAVLYLTDGGVYDNLGSENLLRDSSPFISVDASAVAVSWPEKARPSYFSLWWRILDVSQTQTVSLRRRLLFNRANGIQLILGTPLADIIKSEMQIRHSDLPEYPVINEPGFSELEILVSRLRTDLDAFHDDEIDMLMWAGSIRMDVAVKSLFPDAVSTSSWSDVPPMPSYPIETLKRVLTKGQKRKSLGRLHSNLYD